MMLVVYFEIIFSGIRLTTYDVAGTNFTDNHYAIKLCIVGAVWSGLKHVKKSEFGVTSCNIF